MIGFFESLALYKKISGNDIRMVLLLYNKELRQKDIIKMTGWDRGNVSRCLSVLVMYGIVKRKTNEDFVYYKANKNWRLPDVPGQIVLQLD